MSPSAVGVDLLRVVEPTLQCPTPIVTGKTYLGCDQDSGGTWFAYLYNDNSYSSTLGSTSHAGIKDAALQNTFMERVHSQGDVIVGRGIKDAASPSDTNIVFTWDPVGGTIDQIDKGFKNDSGSQTRVVGPVVLGTTIYWLKVEQNKVSLFSGSVGGTSQTLVSTITSSSINYYQGGDFNLNRAFLIVTASGVVMAQGYDSSRAAGDQGVLTKLSPTIVEFHHTFDDDEAFDDNLATARPRTGGGALTQGKVFGADWELRLISNDGSWQVLGDEAAFGGGLQKTVIPGPDGSDWLFWLAGDDDIVRIPHSSYVGLSGCSTTGTGDVDDSPDDPGFPPVMMHPRD